MLSHSAKMSQDFGMDEKLVARLRSLWQVLYGSNSAALDELLYDVDQARLARSKLEVPSAGADAHWFKDAVTYSVYVDLFNTSFKGLQEKLDHLHNLGITCLHLLPILDSPMKDYGYDVKDYRSIRPALLSLPDNASMQTRDSVFEEFMLQAHKIGIRVIFDVALNHTSDVHPWFQSAVEHGTESPFFDYYIWSDNTDMYSKARIIFKGLCTSNWEYNERLGLYFFHRFFPFQPDLNFRNPKVLVEVCRVFLHWISRGVDGFRLDAIPFLWKEEGTNCENLPYTHVLVKIIRCVSQLISPEIFLLAEACQRPEDVARYFGESADDCECHAAYHFPVMPRLFRSLAEENGRAIISALENMQNDNRDDTQWFIFLRCHDELTLEMVDEDERKALWNRYCRKPEWDFRKGEGISARLFNLMEENVEKYVLAKSLLLTLIGSPVILYGDEFGKQNDDQYYADQVKITGVPDSRYLTRGRIEWSNVETDMKDPQSSTSRIFASLKHRLRVRRKFKCFGRGRLEFINVGDDSMLVYVRSHVHDRICIVNNLSSVSRVVDVPFDLEAFMKKPSKAAQQMVAELEKMKGRVVERVRDALEGKVMPHLGYIGSVTTSSLGGASQVASRTATPVYDEDVFHMEGAPSSASLLHLPPSGITAEAPEDVAKALTDLKQEVKRDMEKMAAYIASKEKEAGGVMGDVLRTLISLDDHVGKMVNSVTGMAHARTVTGIVLPSLPIEREQTQFRPVEPRTDMVPRRAVVDSMLGLTSAIPIHAPLRREEYAESVERGEPSTVVMLAQSAPPTSDKYMKMMRRLAMATAEEEHVAQPAPVPLGDRSRSVSRVRAVDGAATQKDLEEEIMGAVADVVESNLTDMMSGITATTTDLMAAMVDEAKLSPQADSEEVPEVETLTGPNVAESRVTNVVLDILDHATTVAGGVGKGSSTGIGLAQDSAGPGVSAGTIATGMSEPSGAALAALSRVSSTEDLPMPEALDKKRPLTPILSAATLPHVDESPYPPWPKGSYITFVDSLGQLVYVKKEAPCAGRSTICMRPFASLWIRLPLAGEETNREH